MTSTHLFDGQLPDDNNQRIYVWVRDGWSIDENSVRADARQAGNQSSTIYVFIPKRSADDLRHHLIVFKAATSTLGNRGVPNSPEGAEARAAMETIKQTAEARINELLEEAFSGARVFQGGGNEIIGNNLQEIVLEAANNSLKRLYPQFLTADHTGWSKVYEKAQKGAPDALKAVGDDGEPARNPVCKAILSFIAGGKKGVDIRNQFESSPFGWSRDAVDGGLQVLLIAGLIRAQDERGQIIDPKELERKNIGKVTFKVESATVTTAQRIQIRKLLQKAGLMNVKQGEELGYIPQFLQKMVDLADQAGGDAPKPAYPDTEFLNEIRLTAGNEQLLSIYNRREELTQCIDTWTDLAQRITKRWPNWTILKQLVTNASTIQDSEVFISQVKTIETQRQLLVEPDLVTPLISNLSQLLRDELNDLKKQWDTQWAAGESKLDNDENWAKLEPEQRYELRTKQQLVETSVPKISVEDTPAILNTLNTIGIEPLRDRIAAMPGRFDQVVFGAAKLMEPKVQNVSLPNRTLKTDTDVDTWLEEIRAILREKIQKGPVIV